MLYFLHLPKRKYYQAVLSLLENDESYELALPICSDGFTPNAAILMKTPKFRWKIETLLESNLDFLRAMTARLSYRLGAVTYSPFHPQNNPAITPTSPLNEKQINQFLAGPWTASWHAFDRTETPTLFLSGRNGMEMYFIF